MSEHINAEDDIRINVANLYFALQHTPELSSAIEKLSTEINKAQDIIAGVGDVEEYTSVLELAKDSATTTKNYDKTNTIINKLVNTCIAEHKEAEAYTSDIIISKESIDAGLMGEVNDNLKTTQEDIDEMIKQGNQLVARYEEKVAELESKKAILLAEIAAMEEAARRATENNQVYSESNKSIVNKTSIINKSIIQSIK